MSHEHGHDHAPHEHGPGPGPDEPPDVETLFSPAFWDDRYAGVERAWSGKVNARLVEVVDGWAPGRVLDLGAGEGGDAAWFAEQGWEVVAVDVSQVALDRAAASIGSDRVTYRQADLRAWVPDADLGTFDLVTMSYLHLPPEPWARVLGLLGDVVRPGGHLLHVGHHHDDIAVGRWNMPELMPPAAEVAARLDPEEWEIIRADDPTREEHGHHPADDDSTPATPKHVRDTVVLARRR